MNQIKNLIGFLFLISIVHGCSSVSISEKSPTALTRNFTASYIDTWNTVNKVLDNELYKIVDTNKDKGIILLKPIEKGINTLRDYVKSIPPNMRRIELDNVKIIVRGSDNISAVQIIPKFHGWRHISGVSNMNRSINIPVPSMKETLESNGALEMDLFEKISDLLN